MRDIALAHRTREAPGGYGVRRRQAGIKWLAFHRGKECREHGRERPRRTVPELVPVAGYTRCVDDAGLVRKIQSCGSAISFDFNEALAAACIARQVEHR